MKLGKEEIQKIVLGGLLLIGLVYVYFDLLLAPLKRQQVAAKKSTADLSPQIVNAKGQVKRTADLERTFVERTLALRQVDAMIPEGSPVAWFPTKVGDFLKRQGIEKVSTKINTDTPDKDLPGFRRLAWSIDLAKVSYSQFGSAVCALENEDPLLEIRTIQIDASRDDAETQRVTLTVNNLVKQ
jgi:hypothetical protein